MNSMKIDSRKCCKRELARRFRVDSDPDATGGGLEFRFWVRGGYRTDLEFYGGRVEF
jgi:hypothetical protein